MIGDEPASDDAPGRAADYYELTKPRMNFLVLITTMVGFLLARPGNPGGPDAAGASESLSGITTAAASAVRTGVALHTDWATLFHVMFGTGLCAAAAAVLNQLLEVKYDGLMIRTRNRPLPTHRVSRAEALVLGIACGAVGVAYLMTLVNTLTALLGLLTIVWYLGVYTPAKRYTSLNTVIGAVPGAIPPVMGFTAAQGALSPAALALFGILFFWQMPHFLAIAIMYRDDYRRGGFKMLPCVEDDELRMTGRMTVLYAIALLPASLLPVMVGVAGAAYFTAALLLGLGFLSFAVSCAVSRSRADARKLFFASIIYLPLLLAAMMLDKQ